MESNTDLQDKVIFYIAYLLAIHKEVPQISIVTRTERTMVLKIFVSDPLEIMQRITPAIRVIQAALIPQHLYIGIMYSMPPKTEVKCLNLTSHQLN
jgi:hypothetical protein